MKLTNRYTTNKNYYSYKNDYLHTLKTLQLDSLNVDFFDRAYIDGVNAFKNKKLRDFCFNWSSAILGYSAIKNFPCFYLSENLTRLFLDTDIPLNFSYSDNLFVKNGIFLLPKNNPAKIQFILFDDDMCVGKSKLFFVFYKKSNETFGTFFLGHDTQTVNFILDRSSEILDCEKLVINLFLYMATYQEKAYGVDESNIVSDRSGKVVKGFGQKEGLKTPLTIGLQEEKYYRSELAKANPNLQGIKKATHWRRGHWRKVNEDKLTWIRPMLINAC